MKTRKITAIRLKMDDGIYRVIIELSDGKEYIVIHDCGESIDHWVNLKALDLKHCLTY